MGCEEGCFDTIGVPEGSGDGWLETDGSLMGRWLGALELLLGSVLIEGESDGCIVSLRLMEHHLAMKRAGLKQKAGHCT